MWGWQAGSCSAGHTVTPAHLANGTSVFIQPENLKEHFKLTKKYGADGMVVWGEGGPHVSARPGAHSHAATAAAAATHATLHANAGYGMHSLYLAA